MVADEWTKFPLQNAARRSKLKASLRWGVFAIGAISYLTACQGGSLRVASIGRHDYPIGSARQSRSLKASWPRGVGDWLVVPAKRVGAVVLGDPEDKIFELFPRPSIGSSQQAGPAGLACGTDHTIGLLQDARHPGSLGVYAKNGIIVEVEADGARYHTYSGIVTDSSPEEVRLRYKGLKSYLFLGGYTKALNEGPLVPWADEAKGIAFSFAYSSRQDRTLRVFTIIVFRPGASFCVEGSPFPDADHWRELQPYTLGLTGNNI